MSTWREGKKKKKKDNHTHHSGRTKNSVANTGTNFHECSTQTDKHSEGTVCKKVFSSSKAVFADFSLEILCIE